LLIQHEDMKQQQARRAAARAGNGRNGKTQVAKRPA
jgi:hypothetical protein